MMIYLIIAILLLIAIFTALYLYRKKHITEIDRLEQQKLMLEQTPLLDEIAKVEQLNMNGEAAELYARWRQIWTELSEIEFPAITAKLESADDAADRFNFKKAHTLETQVSEEISKSEGRISQVRTELNELLESAEKNHYEIDILQEQYKVSRKTLLAHQYSFGNAAAPLEKRLETFVPQFERYKELTAAGNYLEARVLVDDLAKEGESVFPLIHEIPALLSEIQTKIPASIQELRSGQREMELKSYFLGHLALDAELEDIEAELSDIKADIGNLDIAASKKQVDEIRRRIDFYYEQLETEVKAKQYVDSHIFSFGAKVSDVAQRTGEVVNEYTAIRQSYKISEEQSETPRTCRLRMEHVQDGYEVLLTRYEEDQAAFSNLEEELVNLQGELADIDKKLTEFALFMKNLRIDETASRKKVEDLKRTLMTTDRMLHKANIPGIPEEMDSRLEEAEEQLFIVMQSLREVPLNMQLVDANLMKADNCITETHDTAVEMIENVQLVERIIQYGNRYRNNDPKMNARLLEAEESFRQLRYAKALEEAATAVEAHEPGAIKRIEVLSKEKAARM